MTPVLKVEKEPNCVRRLEIEIEPELVREAREKLVNELTAEAEIRGFRRGKAPRQLVESFYKRRINEQAEGNAVSTAVAEAFREHDLVPVTEPEIKREDTAAGEPIRMTVTLEVSPVIELGSYREIHVPAQKAMPITEEDVDKTIHEMRERAATLIPVTERPTREGDILRLQIQVVGDSQVRTQSYVIGLNTLHPDFDAALVGRREGESDRVEVKFPEDADDKNLAGKTLEIQFSVRSIQEKVLPQADDEFAKDVGSADMKALRDEVRRRLGEAAEQEAREKEMDLLLDAITSGSSYEFPETLIRGETTRILTDEENRLRRIGTSLRFMNVEAGELRAIGRDAALRQLKIGFSLGEIAEKEDLRLTEEEYKERLRAELVEQAASEEQIEEALNREVDAQLLDRWTVERTLDFLRRQNVFDETE